MEPVMALSDFMPYGAPELLEGASPRMARSTLVASGIVGVLVLGIGMLLSMQPRSIERIIEFRAVDQLLQQPNVDVPTDPTPLVHEFVRPDAQVVPVPDAPILEPTESVPDPGLPVGGTTTGPVENAGPATRCETCPDPTREPSSTDYVYVEELPRLVHSTKPSYPDIAREAGVEGTVKLNLLVGLDGHVRRAIVRPGGSVPMLDQAAIDAAMTCVFTPALANRQPVMVWVTQDYRFQLH